MNSNRRKLLQTAVLASTTFCLPSLARSTDSPDASKIIEAIKSRRSVRAYTAAPISASDLKTILECGMLAPSAANEQPWEFIVIEDKAILGKIGEINHYASFAKHAPLAILACLNEAKEKEKGMGVLDIAIACENMLLAAHALGLGGVFTGIYPIKERIEGCQKLADLPATVVPIGLLVFGHPQINSVRSPDRFNVDAIHKNKWNAK